MGEGESCFANLSGQTADLSVGPLQEAVKRSLDFFFSAVGLVLLSPLLLVTSLAIKLDSRGPVFHGSERIGRYGRPFRMWKFRTMYLNSEKLGVTTGLNDPRVTGVGRFLRRYKIDELPQLVNVLTGEMSLVGPRPEFQEHTAEYTGEEELILTVRPGITDYASVRFRNQDELIGSEDPHRMFIEKIRPEKNRLRVDYVKRQSLAEDFKILFQTILCVIGRR
jgi:lipopolysaccharide/colanic/teichoic acid biosynthesis glycosyltransferase